MLWISDDQEKNERVPSSHVSADPFVVNDLTEPSCTGFACVYVAGINQSLTYTVFQTKRLLHSMLLRIYWIEQIAFLDTSQATISALKNDVNLLRAMLHCVRAFMFEKTISTSTTKYKCRCELGKTKQDLATPLREISPTQILIILPISNILRCFDRDFRRPYR